MNFGSLHEFTMFTRCVYPGLRGVCVLQPSFQLFECKAGQDMLAPLAKNGQSVLRFEVIGQALPRTARPRG
eukprot:s1156_g16.t1